MQRHIKAVFLLIICTGFFLAYDASAQFGNYKQKKRRYKTQNSRTARFTGEKIVFGNAKQYITLGVSANALNYFGDIVPDQRLVSTDISFTRAGLGLSSSVRVGAALAVRAELLFGQLKSSDYQVADPKNDEAIYRYARNLHFRNNIQDFSLVSTYDFFSNPGTVMFRMGFTPYIFAGISVFHHNPKGLVPENAMLTPGDSIHLPEAGQWVSLRKLHTEGVENSYSAFQISIPFGLGARFRLNQFMDLEAEMSYRYLFTDYIDDVSTNYVDKGTLESDLARVMSDRSMEQTDALTGKERFQALVDSELINTNGITTYTGADGKEYIILPGYGQPDQIRGSSNDNDMFITTTIRLVIIIGKSPFARSKFH